jgi:DNA gyrase/topoisomerase IV subunit A
LATERGRVLIFHIGEIPPKSAAVRGVNAIRLDKLDRVLAFALSRRKRQGLRTWTSRGREVIVRETSYRPIKRGGKGQIVIRVGKLERYETPVFIYKPGSDEEEEERLEGEEMEASEEASEETSEETPDPTPEEDRP